METYHETIIDLIYYILSKGETYLEFIDTRNAYDKIIRNYHQVNSNGVSVYRNNRSKMFYRCSEKAYKETETSNLYFEHLVPIKLLKEQLKSLIITEELTKVRIKNILDSSEMVLITKEEAKIIDEKHKTSLPKSNKNRLEEYGIKIAKDTQNNSIFF